MPGGGRTKTGAPAPPLAAAADVGDGRGGATGTDGRPTSEAPRRDRGSAECAVRGGGVAAAGAPRCATACRPRATAPLPLPPTLPMSPPLPPLSRPPPPPPPPPPPLTMDSTACSWCRRSAISASRSASAACTCSSRSPPSSCGAAMLLRGWCAASSGVRHVDTVEGRSLHNKQQAAVSARGSSSNLQRQQQRRQRQHSAAAAAASAAVPAAAAAQCHCHSNKERDTREREEEKRGGTVTQGGTQCR